MQQIPKSTIELYFRVRANHPNVHYIAYYLEYLTFHIPERMLVPALEWLVKNKIVGERFIEFIHNDCAKSGLEMIRYLTMRLEKEQKTRKLYAMDLA